MSKTYLVIGFLFTQFFVYSQKKSIEYSLSGIVSDSLYLPIDYVQIVVQTSQNSILSYTQSDSLGHYVISYQTDLDSIMLTVSRLGFLPLSIKISTKTESHDIVLKQSDKSYLKEIIISGRKLIVSSGDTINYDVNVFKDGTEINVEDVLSKLPGVSVDENSGKIKYQGREIEKILLDGDDLAGENYKILSKNLSADWLDEVEILKNFTDKRLLHGIKKSDDIAINLKLNEDAKAPLFGTSKLGVGTMLKYLSKLELLSYLKKIKSFTIAETNNTGTDLETYDLETYASSQLKYINFLSADNLLNNELTPPPYFRNENFTFQEGQFVSNATIIKLSEKLNIRSTTTFYNNRLKFNFKDSLAYFLPNRLTLSINQDQDQIQKPLEIFQDLKFDYRLSEKKDLSARIQFRHSDERLTAFNKTSYRNVQQTDDTGQLQLFGSLNYMNKLNTRWALETDLQFGIDDLSEKLEVISVITQEDNIEQIVQQEYKNFGGFLNLHGKIDSTLYVNILTGWTATSTEFDARNIFLNNYEMDNIFSEVNLKKYIKKFKLNLGNRFRYFGLSYNDLKKSRFLAEPTVALSFEDTIFKYLETQIKGLYNLEYNFLKPSTLYNHPLAVSFRTRVNYLANPYSPTQRELFLLSIKLSDNEKSYLTGTIEWGYQKSKNDFVPEISYDEDIIQNTYRQNGEVNTFFSIYSIDKYIQKLQTSIKLTYENQIKSTLQSVENEYGQNVLKQDNLNVIAGVILTKKINVSTAFKYFYYQNNWLNTKTDFNFKNYVFKVIYKHSSSLKFNADFQAVDFGKSLGEIRSMLGANVKYISKNEKWTLEASLNNGINKSIVNIRSVEPSFFSTSSFPLQARFVLVSGKYMF